MRAPERRGELTPWHVVRFFSGVVTAALALGSPLHSVGEAYLLTAHMAQHLVVTLAVPPLLITGIPAWMVRPVLTWPPLAPAIKVLLSPVPAFLIFNTVFLGWHVPAFYELALAVPEVHALEHGLMILTATLTWWPVFGTLWEYPRLPYGGQVMYLARTGLQFPVDFFHVVHEGAHSAPPTISSAASRSRSRASSSRVK